MPSLAGLPRDLMEDIIEMVMSTERSRARAQLAAVNSVFQEIVEKSTFRSLRLTEAELATAMWVLQRRAGRSSLVRTINYGIALPPYSRVACTMMETEAERFRNDLAFSKALNKLLSHLEDWPSTGGALEIELFAFSPTDGRRLLGGQWYRNWYGFVPGDILHYRTYGSTLEYHKAGNKRSDAVTKITWRNDCERYISARGLQRLVESFPRLREVDFRLWDLYKHDPVAVRRSVRRRMAAVLDNLPDGVSIMNFHFEYSTPADQRYNAQDIRDPHGGADPLTVAFRNASQKMTVIGVHGMLGTPELLWPRQVSDTNPAPFWPNLEFMELYYHITGPDGKWLFGQDQAVHVDERRFQAELPLYDLPAPHRVADEDFRPMQNRFTAYQETMDRFYISAAHAVGNMPKLRYLRLHALMYWYSTPAPFHIFELDISEDGRRCSATWTGEPPFEPSTAVLNIWRRMAYERCMSIRFASVEPTQLEYPEFFLQFAG